MVVAVFGIKGPYNRIAAGCSVPLCVTSSGVSHSSPYLGCQYEGGVQDSVPKAPWSTQRSFIHYSAYDALTVITLSPPRNWSPADAPCSSPCEICMPMSSWHHPLITFPGDCLLPTSQKVLELTDVTWPVHCYNTDRKQTWENKAHTQCSEDMDPGLLIMNKVHSLLSIPKKQGELNFQRKLTIFQTDKKKNKNRTKPCTSWPQSSQWKGVMGCAELQPAPQHLYSMENLPAGSHSGSSLYTTDICNSLTFALIYCLLTDADKCYWKPAGRMVASECLIVEMSKIIWLNIHIFNITSFETSTYINQFITVSLNY